MLFFFLNDTPTTEIYPLSLHDALPICSGGSGFLPSGTSSVRPGRTSAESSMPLRDRKSTRLNSSHANISYAVFCLKKKINIADAVAFLFPAWHAHRHRSGPHSHQQGDM